MYEKKYVSLESYICPVCGKEFIPATEHIYSAFFGKNRKLVCRWTCMAKAQREHEEQLKQNRRPT
jgi:hypothetical protein